MGAMREYLTDLEFTEIADPHPLSLRVDAPISTRPISVQTHTVRLQRGESTKVTLRTGEVVRVVRHRYPLDPPEGR